VGSGEKKLQLKIYRLFFSRRPHKKCRKYKSAVINSKSVIKNGNSPRHTNMKYEKVQKPPPLKNARMLVDVCRKWGKRFWRRDFRPFSFLTGAKE